MEEQTPFRKGMFECERVYEKFHLDFSLPPPFFFLPCFGMKQLKKEKGRKFFSRLQRIVIKIFYVYFYIRVKYKRGWVEKRKRFGFKGGGMGMKVE